MNQFIKYASILMFSTALVSCGDGSHNHSVSEGDNHSEHHAEDQDHNLNSKSTIALNNGEKWLVNDEMKPHVAQGEKALDDYLASNGADYKTLAKELQSADKNLISSCTMDGKSHDELHKWLEPHLGLVSKLEGAQTKDEADEVIEKLNESFKNYHTYFE